jgi:transposase
MSTESKWAARVAEWRRSGVTAAEYCAGRDFSPGGLRYWSSRLKAQKAAKDARLARVVSSTDPTVADTAVVIEAGAVRIGVRCGFDPEVLRAVLLVLAAGSR